MATATSDGTIFRSPVWLTNPALLVVDNEGAEKLILVVGWHAKLVLSHELPQIGFKLFHRNHATRWRSGQLEFRWGKSCLASFVCAIYDRTRFFVTSAVALVFIWLYQGLWEVNIAETAAPLILLLSVFMHQSWDNVNIASLPHDNMFGPRPSPEQREKQSLKSFLDY